MLKTGMVKNEGIRILRVKYGTTILGTSQRLNGKVSGVLNGVPFSNLDMHSFVITKDGRAYTAISRVPTEIGSQMLTLNTIGGIIGWLFALPTSAGAFNGYSFTGKLTVCIQLIYVNMYMCIAFLYM